MSFGRVYIDQNYSCVQFDENNPPDAIKYANALLAEDYIQGKLIADGGQVRGAVKSERVKAGSVESETEYFGSSTTSYQADVDYILSQYCIKLTSGNTKLVFRI